MRRRAWVALGAAAVAALGGAGYAAAATTSTPVTCHSDGTTLSCPIPKVTTTRTVTATKTVTVTPTPPPSTPSSSTAAPTSSTPTSATPTPTSSSTSAPPESGGFPDASNTGIPAGTTLTPWTGGCEITVDNTVISGKTVNCELVIHAAGVVIDKSKVNGLVSIDPDSMPSDNAWSVTIQDSEVDEGTAANTAVCCANLTVLRSNIHGGQTAVQCDNVVGDGTPAGDRYVGATGCDVRDSWLHGQLDGGPVGKAHLGGLLSDGGRNITVIHNTLACDHPVENGEGCTGDANFMPHFIKIQNLDVENNLFVAGNDRISYCTYAGSMAAGEQGGVGSNIVYKNNVFQHGNATPPSDGHGNDCGAYGPVTFWQDGPGNVWSGNVWDSGEPVQPSA